jgi:hypothetical protein
MGPIIGAILVFVVAALLYYQSHSTEAFRNPTDAPITRPVAGRPYGAEGERANFNWQIPADLNRAPVAAPAMSQVPVTQKRPTAIPGAPTAPREAMAERKDLYELDDKISTWLFAATQREADHPGSLTPEQSQRRIMLQARLAQVRRELVNDMITTTYKQAASEIAELRRENAGWGRLAPSLDAIHSFASHVPADAFLTAEQYREFRSLFDSTLNEFKGHSQPNPLERVRLQQMELIQQDLLRAEKDFPVPPIRAGNARLFLQQAVRVDQPLPTLFAMEPAPQAMPAPHSVNPADVISQLRDIEWRLTVSYNPAEQELKREVAALLRHLQSGTATPRVIEKARSATADLTHRLAPRSLAGTASAVTAGIGSVSSEGAASAVAAPLQWDPNNLQLRANQMCYQIREAFPKDAEALGCPPVGKPIDTDAEAENAINQVCARLRYSVPTVSPAQFGCPSRPV